MIEINNIKKEYADKLLFNNFSTTIYDGEKIGIVGFNGCGKSTLLKIISGEVELDSGSIKTTNTNIGYLKQISSYSTDDFLAMCEESSSIKNFFKLTRELNLNIDDFSRDRLEKLSFGEKTKLMLASILAKSPDILLLDEPTNHLDQQGVEWLANLLNCLDITILVVSHDRFFLNRVVNKILEIDDGKINQYYGNYDNYSNQRQERFDYESKVYNERLKENKKVESQVARLRESANKLEKTTKRDGSSDRRSKGYKISVQMKVKKLANQMQAKANRLDKMHQELGEKPKSDRKIFYALTNNKIGSKVLVEAKNLSKSFGQNIIFQNANFIINAGDKVALKGTNGSGKTTLLEMIVGIDAKYQGEIWLSPSLKIAYLKQDVLDLDEKLTVLQMARKGGSHTYTTQFLSNLANMGMTKQIFDRKIGTLSLGERMRLKLCEIVLSDYNLLVLDEPTNHLDLPNRVFLEKILTDFQGSLILVSHDKILCDKVCNKVFEISNKTIEKY